MSEFEIGQQVAVSDVSIKRALEQLEKESVKFYYLFTKTNEYIVVRSVKPDGSDYVSCFQYVTAMPEEPKLTMFTHKTFPRGLIYVRRADSLALIELETESLVLGIRKNGIGTSSGSPIYAALLDDYEMSFDNCKSWVPCGELK